MSDERLRIAVTMGDPAGVGPEICLRALREIPQQGFCVPVVFGDAGVLRRCAEAIGVPLEAAVIPAAGGFDALQGLAEPAVLDLAAIDAAAIVPGQVTADTGRAAFAYIQCALDAVRAEAVDGVTTAPISKEALAAAGIRFPGHTEIFADACGTDRFCMMQYSAEITCTFVTVHVGYAEVPGLLSEERIREVILLTAAAMRRLRGHNPHLVVCGLNPHAGEHGLFGHREEERLIVPAIEACRRQGLSIDGPLPPDTAFVPARRKTTDAFVCMYHDQGHIPVKALAFDSAVNTTLGLPVVRTSVDHGTACDIAWQGTAMPDSLFAALRVAAQLCRSPVQSAATGRRSGRSLT